MHHSYNTQAISNDSGCISVDFLLD